MNLIQLIQHKRFIGGVIVVAFALVVWSYFYTPAVPNHQPIPAKVDRLNKSEAKGALPATQNSARVEALPRPAHNPGERLRIDDSILEFAKAFPQLVARANRGDLEAAKAIYNGLYPCLDAPRTPEDIGALVNTAAAQFGKSSESYKASVDFANSMYRKCSTFTPQELASYRHWLALAASQGDAKARLDYVLTGAPKVATEGEHYAAAKAEYERLAAEYLNGEIKSGNVDALVVASAAYGNDYLFAPDPIKQYAYLYAYVLTTGGEKSSSVYFDSLMRLQGRMSAEDVATATKQGVRIYEECCRGNG